MSYYSPVSATSTTLRPLISFLLEARSILLPRPSQQHVQFSLYVHLRCSFTSHLQYEVHDMPADQQLQLVLEHGGTDLHPQATNSNNSLGATTLPQTGTEMPSSIFHQNMERLAALGIILISCSPDKHLQMSTFDLLYCCLVIRR